MTERLELTFSMRGSRGSRASAYIGIANGSPCVVPSREYRVVPSTKSSPSLRYVLMRAIAIDGQRALMFLRATWRFSELKGLLASISRTASQSCFLKAWFMACTAASVPVFWPAQSCREPATSWMSPPDTERIAFAMILLTIPIGRTHGFLSNAMRA